MSPNVQHTRITRKTGWSHPALESHNSVSQARRSIPSLGLGIVDGLQVSVMGPTQMENEKRIACLVATSCLIEPVKLMYTT